MLQNFIDHNDPQLDKLIHWFPVFAVFIQTSRTKEVSPSAPNVSIVGYHYILTNGIQVICMDVALTLAHERCLGFPFSKESKNAS